MVEQRPFKPKVVGSIPTAPTNIFLFLLELQKPEGARGALAASPTRSSGDCLRWNDQTNHFAVRFSKGVRNSLRIDIHGRANIRMPQEFLLHLQIDAQCVKHGGMAMPKGMPADATYPHFHRCGNKPILLHSARPVWLACLWVSEDPILDVRTQANLSRCWRNLSARERSRGIHFWEVWVFTSPCLP